MKRDGLGDVSLRVLGGVGVRPVYGVALGGRGQVQNGLREGRIPLWHAKEMHRLFGGDGHSEPLGIRVPDILRSEAHESSGNVEGILARLDHSGQPVHGRVRITVSHRLVQRGNQVVVLFA